MKSTEIKFTAIPSTEEVKAERDRLAYRSRYGRVLRSTIYALVVVAAVAVLLATLFPAGAAGVRRQHEPHAGGPGYSAAGQVRQHENRRPVRLLLAVQVLLKRVIAANGDVISMTRISPHCERHRAISRGRAGTGRM